MSMNLAKEPPSKPLARPMIVGPYNWGDGARGVLYENDAYSIAVRWDWLGDETETDSAMLQVSRIDGGSVMDWRDLQAIKSAILGPEWEGVELYPAESRLKDPSNARYLWCRRTAFPFGMKPPRVVFNSDVAIAPQRPFDEPEGR